MDHCTYHSRKEAEYTCLHCRKRVCRSCVILVEGEPFCQICWNGFVTEANRQPKETAKPSAIPWHHRGELGWVLAFWKTAQQVVFQPGWFFSHISGKTDFAAPLLFAGICVLLFWFPVNVLYIKVLFPPLLNAWSTNETSPEEGVVIQSAPSMTQEIRTRLQSVTQADLLRMPIDFLISNILLASLLQQGLVSLFHGRQGYAATLQIRCYTLIVQCLLLIPFLGIVLTEIVSLALCTRGFQVAQRLSLFQAFLVALVPMMFSILVMLLVMVRS